LEQFDFALRPELKRSVMVRFFDSAFVEKAGALLLIGPSGVGKTHLAIALGTRMVQLGYSVRFLTAQQFANAVLAAQGRVARERLLMPLIHCDLLILDEFGYLSVDPQVGPALYELVSSRYTHRATVITANKSLATWGELVGGDTALMMAILDRLLQHGEVFYLRGASYRMRGKAPLVLGARAQHQRRDRGARSSCWVTFSRKGGEKMGAKTPTVSEGSVYDPRQAGSAIRLDTPAWFAWLAVPSTTCFSYPLYDPARGYIVGFMTVRKEGRQRGGMDWSVFRRCGRRVRKIYLGRSTTVTQARLQAIAEALRGTPAEQGRTDTSTP